jgi:gamma-glutamylcyclotransferase (GGCT)/AIG2-like uncharacterized protein YtfP
MTEEYLPLFVYGTLRPRDYNYMIFLIGRTQQEEHGYIIAGVQLYDLGLYPMARETLDPSHIVKGDLITIPPQLYPSVLQSVDMLEDYVRGRDHNPYVRSIRTVTGPDGQQQRAWIYLGSDNHFNNLKPAPVLIPSGDWLTWKKNKRP